MLAINVPFREEPAAVDRRCSARAVPNAAAVALALATMLLALLFVALVYHCRTRGLDHRGSPSNERRLRYRRGALRWVPPRPARPRDPGVRVLVLQVLPLGNTF